MKGIYRLVGIIIALAVLAYIGNMIVDSITTVTQAHQSQMYR